MCCPNWYLFCHQWLDFKFPWLKWCPQLRLCIFLTALWIYISWLIFCGIDIHDWIVHFLDLWRVQLDVIFQSTFLYWFREIHTLILEIHNFYTDSYIWITIHHTMQYTNQVLESIVPSSWSKQLDDDKASSVMNVVHILQTDKPTHQWDFFIQKQISQSFQIWCHASINCTCIYLCPNFE